jgi:rSAM/selenodomain-associated transferase 2
VKLSVIVPMLNEAAAIAATLRAIRVGAPAAEIVVVDGGSIDSSVELARPLCDRLIQTGRGRARQMNAGAGAASGDVFAFVHADTEVPQSFEHDIAAALADSGIVGGRFDVRLDDPAIALRVIGALISIRSRLTRTGTGDQAIFARREVFERLGGFPEIDLCEDLAFTRMLKRAGRVACLRSCVVTSARRWRGGGLVTTVLRMWTIRLLFLAGVSPARLKHLYSDASPTQGNG